MAEEFNRKLLGVIFVQGDFSSKIVEISSLEYLSFTRTSTTNSANSVTVTDLDGTTAKVSIGKAF